MSDGGESIREQAARALPQVDGGLRVAGLREPVEVIRLQAVPGVPYIYARNIHDLYFAQGFVAASERLFQIDLMLRTGTGRLAALVGELGLPIDKLARTVGWNRAGRRIAAKWDPLSHEIVGDWFDGVRAYSEVMPAPPPEYSLLSAGPELPAGGEAIEQLASVAVFMSWSLCGNMDAELLRLKLGEHLGREAMLELMPVTGNGLGSNAWAVNGSLTESGKPMLANDVHLAVQTPSIWFACHLAAPGFEVGGASLPFAPGIPIGRTSFTAWGVTNTGGDVQDLYLERLNDQGDAALFRDEWEPLTVHEEKIEVRGQAEPVVINARETRHGPLLDSYVLGSGTPLVIEGGIDEPVALRWIGLDEATPPSTLHHMAQARNFAEFRSAVKTWVCPGSNLIYADAEGNIGHQVTGSYPIRNGSDGTEPVPGWTGEFEWEGTVPFEELPSRLNPPEGYVISANERPIGDDAHVLGEDLTSPHRAIRIEELLTAQRHLGWPMWASFATIQEDALSLPAREIVPLLLEVQPRDEQQRATLEMLGDWDFVVDSRSRAALLYEIWCTRIAERILRPRLGDALYDQYYAHRRGTDTFRSEVLPRFLAEPTERWFGEEGRDALLHAALDDALDALAPRETWGNRHTVTFASPLAKGDFAQFFNAGGISISGDENTILQSRFEPGKGLQAVVTPSWRMVVDLSGEWDWAALAPGQSGNPASPYWKTFADGWKEGEYSILMPFERTSLEHYAFEGVLTLRPTSVSSRNDA